MHPSQLQGDNGAQTSGSSHLAILLQRGGPLAARQPLDVFKAFAEPEMKQEAQDGDGSLKQEPLGSPLLYSRPSLNLRGWAIV